MPIFTLVLSGFLLAFNTTVERAGTVSVTFSFRSVGSGFPKRVCQPPLVVAVLIVILEALDELLNATKYSSKKENPLVEVGVMETDKGHTYFVKDNGAGFDMTYYDKLFGVFQRFHRQDEFEGTGVGLAIVQKIILKHGGQIWAEATVNEGACFYFTLQ